MPSVDFAWVWFLWLLLLLIPMWMVQKRSHGTVIHSYLALMVRKLGGNIGPRGQLRTFLFMALVWSLLVLALMRPIRLGEPIELSREGRNIMMVLDISESMETPDMIMNASATDRLTVAKSILMDFVEKRKTDRLGLVIFASKAMLHAPLTFDHRALKTFIDESEIGFLGPKTAFGDALALSVKKLMEERGQSVIIALTDGQTNAGYVEPQMAASMAKSAGIKIFVVGMGAERMQVRSFFGNGVVNPSSDLDEAEPVLRQITESTGGEYFRAHDSAALASAYQKIDELMPSLGEPRVLVPRRELFFWPLGIALLLLTVLPLINRIKGGLRKGHV